MATKKIWFHWTLGLVELHDGRVMNTTITRVSKILGRKAEVVEVCGKPKQVLDKNGKKHTIYTTIDGKEIITN